MDSILDQGVYRTFIVHLPNGFPTKPVSLVLNFHGLNSNAAQQEFYSQFNLVTDNFGFVVVYPNAISGSWNLTNDKDVDFVSHLIDTLRSRYPINDCLFLTGMSMGGFLSYTLACALKKEISAIAVVTGNMLQIQQRTCSVTKGLPVLHIHGTMDAVVNYNGSPGISPVDSTIRWWVNQNNCNPIPDITNLPDIAPGDQCTAQRHVYTGGRNNSEVRLYKIIDGGHTWPGAFPVPSLGPTNQDFHASTVIGEFFQNHCGKPVKNPSIPLNSSFKYYPNPVKNILNIQWDESVFDFQILNLQGKIILGKNDIHSNQQIELSTFANGFYILHVSNEKMQFREKFCLLHE